MEAANAVSSENVKARSLIMGPDEELSEWILTAWFLELWRITSFCKFLLWTRIIIVYASGCNLKYAVHCAAFSYFFSLCWCRVDVVIFVIWELVILAFLVFSAVSLYFRHLKLAFILVCVTLLLLLCMKIAKQVRSARKKKRRMLLPLSM